MLDEHLFRWNLVLNLICKVCYGDVFVEEVSVEEIFCAKCGIVPDPCEADLGD
jgi:transcription initiation factor TFIIIB Brf1 subunit/transcription initiation factor TFIIB